MRVFATPSERTMTWAILMMRSPAEPRCLTLNSDLLLLHIMRGERNSSLALAIALLIFYGGLVAYDGESHSDTEHNSKSASKRQGKRRHVRVFTFYCSSQFPSSRMVPLFWLG